MKNFVLFLTIFRIIAGPIIFFLTIIFKFYLLGLLLFIAASFTDYLDGKLAREYKVESSLGATLDPIADKILVLFSLFTISLINKDVFISGMSVLILSREFWVSALREHVAQFSKSNLMKVTFLAKIKTTIQFIAIALFFLGFETDFALIIFIASFVLFLAMLISIKTAIEYTHNFYYYQNKQPDYD